MENLQATVALLVGVAVVFLVPALVWATVIAGLIQIVQAKVRESRAARTARRQAESEITL